MMNYILKLFYQLLQLLLSQSHSKIGDCKTCEPYHKNTKSQPPLASVINQVAYALISLFILE